MTNFVVKAGTYWLGDPCYCFNNSWSDVLGSSDFFQKPYVKDGRTAVAFGTMHGDGTYQDQNGYEYDVDSGMIGLVPIQMAEKNPGNSSQKVTFKKSAECRAEDGKLCFGEYKIDTAQEEEEEETCPHCGR